MSRPDILCIGSVLWDVIGRGPRPMQAGDDMPGRIMRIPGGVALNIAMELARHGLRPALLSAIGQDAPGAELTAACAQMGLLTQYMLHLPDLPTDSYMAIEGAGHLIAAMADAHTLESAGEQILAPLVDGRLGDAQSPYAGGIALDGNLTEALLSQIATGALFSRADLRIAPASPGKAERLRPFITAGRGVLYVNLFEAGLLCEASFASAAQAAQALIAHGARRALVTDGARPCADACASSLYEAKPPAVTVTRVTGAGDTFMAAHIAAEQGGANRADALNFAVTSAAGYVSKKGS